MQKRRTMKRQVVEAILSTTTDRIIPSNQIQKVVALAQRAAKVCRMRISRRRIWRRTWIKTSSLAMTVQKQINQKQTKMMKTESSSS